jgi:hypothetical protein
VAEIKLACKLAQTPAGSAKIYRLKKTAVNERSLRALAKRFGLRGAARDGSLCSDADKLTYAEGPLELIMYRASGAIRFRDRSRWQVDDGRVDFKLEDQGARRIAQNFVRKYRWAPSAEVRFLKAAHLRVGEMNGKTRESYERMIDVAIALQRVIDKVPVDGPGGKIVVYLDREGEITGFERIWREIAGRYERAGSLRSPQAAIEEMAAQWKGRQGIVEVTEVRYGYFEAGWRVRQGYLQPAYVIIGTARQPESRVGRKVIYVATALEKPLGRLTPALREKPRQRPRHAGDERAPRAKTP